MPNYCKIIVAGHVTRDPQSKQLPTTTIADFGIACNHRRKDASGQQRDEVMFIDVTAFGRQAETIVQYVHKGDPILVDGRLTLDQWTDKDGNKRSKHKVIVEAFTFLGSKSDDAPTAKPAQQPDAPTAAEESVPDETIPF